MSKLFMVTDGIGVITVDFDRKKIEGDLELLLQEDKYKDNDYLKLSIKEMEYEGEIHKGNNLINIITVYSEPKKVFVNKVVAATQYRADKDFDNDEEGKYDNRFFTIEV